MTLRQLKYFLEIAQLRSFTRASEVLHVAQPALSRQIRALEEEFDLPLFNRVDRGVTLTEAGERLRDRVKVMLSSFDRLRDDVIASANEPHGGLTVGLAPSLREMVNVPLIDEYTRVYPGVRLDVHEGISLDLERLVQLGRIDCACVIDLDASRSLVTERVLREQLFLIGPVSAGLRVDLPVTLADVAELDLILTTRPNSLRLIVEHALARTRKPYRVVADFNTTGFMVELVKQGMAFSVLPYCAAWAAYRKHEIAVAPIRELTIDWVMISHRDRPLSLAAAKLSELVRDIAKRRIENGNWVSAQLIPPA
mgnify:CR=1 FL=1